jgi:hypothetical protein
MRTTIDLPDALLRRAKAQAALSGTSLKELIARALDQGLRNSPASTSRKRSKLPVARGTTGRTLPSFSSAEFHRLLDEE